MGEQVRQPLPVHGVQHRGSAWNGLAVSGAADRWDADRTTPRRHAATSAQRGVSARWWERLLRQVVRRHDARYMVQMKRAETPGLESAVSGESAARGQDITTGRCASTSSSNDGSRRPGPIRPCPHRHVDPSRESQEMAVQHNRLVQLSPAGGGSARTRPRTCARWWRRGVEIGMMTAARSGPA